MNASSNSTPRLLTGGNPQIPMGDGDGPVQDYIAAMPGWKSAFGARLDDLIVGVVPNVQKAVKWNTPLYGAEDIGFFVGFNCCTRYIKVSFFKGASLDPMPPEASKQADVRYLHIFENKPFDEAQFTDWVRQASIIPGWIMKRS